MRSIHDPRGDDAILRHASDMQLLRAIAEGRVVRGFKGGGETGVWAPHVVDGDRVNHPDLRRLDRDDLIFLRISGPPQLAPRGRRLLDLAAGEGAPS